MTDHDIQLLALGFMLGGYVILLVQLLGDARDDRRDRKALQAAEGWASVPTPGGAQQGVGHE